MLKKNQNDQNYNNNIIKIKKNYVILSIDGMVSENMIDR